MRKATKAYLRTVRELLRQKKARDASGLFVVEGEKIIRDMFRKKQNIQSVLLSESFLGKDQVNGFMEQCADNGVEVYKAGDNDFGNTSGLSSPSGILAVVEAFEKPAALPDAAGPSFIVLCDGLQDPLNLGVILRACAAFDVDLVILTGDSVDLYNPKLIRSSAGLVLDIPVLSCGYNELRDLKGRGFKFFVSHFKYDDAVSIDNISEMPAHSVITFGSEGRGLSEEVISLADVYFKVPMAGRAESLNVTSAAAITIYSLIKRRKHD